MGLAFPEILARSAARQVYRLLRPSAPLLAGQAFIGIHHSLAAVGKSMRERLASLGLLDQPGGA